MYQPEKCLFQHCNNEILVISPLSAAHFPQPPPTPHSHWAQSIAHYLQPSAHHQQPTTKSPLPQASPQPKVIIPQPTAINPQLTTNYPQLSTHSQLPRVEKCSTLCRTLEMLTPLTTSYSCILSFIFWRNTWGTHTLYIIIHRDLQND